MVWATEGRMCNAYYLFDEISIWIWVVFFFSLSCCLPIWYVRSMWVCCLEMEIMTEGWMRNAYYLFDEISVRIWVGFFFFLSCLSSYMIYIRSMWVFCLAVAMRSDFWFNFNAGKVKNTPKPCLVTHFENKNGWRWNCKHVFKNYSESILKMSHSWKRFIYFVHLKKKM